MVIASREPFMDINELTYQIRGAVFKVNCELGSGLLLIGDICSEGSKVHSNVNSRG